MKSNTPTKSTVRRLTEEEWVREEQRIPTWTIVDSIKPHYEIRIKDIDPDTGKVCIDRAIALTSDEQSAGMITQALNLTDQEPNRSYYSVYRAPITK